MYQELFNVLFDKKVTNINTDKRVSEGEGVVTPDAGRVLGALMGASRKGVKVVKAFRRGLSVCTRYSILSASLIQACT